MRLKEKLLRERCPACGAEITLGASSLNKKISCPKCMATVIIPSASAVPPPPPAPVKKKRVQEKRAVEKLSDRPTPPEPLREVEETPIPRLFIEVERPRVIPEPAPVEETPPVPDSGPRQVVYCLCNGAIRRSVNANGFCSAPGVCCIYANQPGS